MNFIQLPRFLDSKQFSQMSTVKIKFLNTYYYCASSFHKLGSNKICKNATEKALLIDAQIDNKLNLLTSHKFMEDGVIPVKRSLSPKRDKQYVGRVSVNNDILLQGKYTVTENRGFRR